MNIEFLGGASGVGATCYLIQLAGRHILVDAGVRMGSGDRLPNLAALDGINLDAILISHAHADHIGALPLLASRFPATPIYASAATIALIEVMLGDAVRVMARRAAEELDLPLYDDVQVAETLRRLRPLRAGPQTLHELPGVVVHTQRAGHIAGAISLGFEAEDGRLAVSGDVSVTPQRTILGATAPTPKYADLLILESTYGARLHPNRTQEEQKLADAVATVIARGGHCLIPAFALGRAQEVILILRAAQRDGRIPEFPIAVDGLVRSVCAAYAAIPMALTPALQRHIERGGKPFFGKTVRSILTTQDREKVIAGPPSAIISSSGMLSGGPSVWYAVRLAANPQAAIFFSGYLDEEAPGRALLALADAAPASRHITLNGQTLPIACQVGRYSLSAHADGDELTSLVRAAQPKTVALVHGDAEARAALRERLRGFTNVVLPEDGQTLVIAPAVKNGRRTISPSVVGSPTVVGIGAGQGGEEIDFDRLWAALRDGTGTQIFSVRALTRAWYGDDASDAHTAQMAAALEVGSMMFVPLPGVEGLWRLPAPTAVRRAQAAHTASGAPQPLRGRPDQAGILAVVDHYLGHADDLYQRSIDPATGALTLRYFFPAVAEIRDAQQLHAIAAEAGVSVAVWPQPHQGQLAQAALHALPEGITSTHAPSLRFEPRIVELRCTGHAEAASIAHACGSFAARTGWTLSLVGIALPPPATSTSSALLPLIADSEQAIFFPPLDIPRTEVNYALATARTWFGEETGCYKASADQQAGVIRLRFYFPDAAQHQYVEQFAELASYVGWAVQLWPHPHQAALMQAARDQLPTGISLVSTPVLQPQTREVALRVRGTIPPSALLTMCASFVKQTGWQLVVRP